MGIDIDTDMDIDVHLSLPQPICITDVSIRRLNTGHKVSPRSQLAHISLIQRLAEVRWVVVCVSNNYSDTDITAEGRVPTVCCSNDEVVALGELIVEHACSEHQTAVTVDVEVVSAVVDVRQDLVSHHSVLLRVLVQSKHLQRANTQLSGFMHYSRPGPDCTSRHI